MSGTVPTDEGPHLLTPLQQVQYLGALPRCLCIRCKGTCFAAHRTEREPPIKELAQEYGSPPLAPDVAPKQVRVKVFFPVTLDDAGQLITPKRDDQVDLLYEHLSPVSRQPCWQPRTILSLPFWTDDRVCVLLDSIGPYDLVKVTLLLSSALAKRPRLHSAC